MKDLQLMMCHLTCMSNLMHELESMQIWLGGKVYGMFLAVIGWHRLDHHHLSGLTFMMVPLSWVIQPALDMRSCRMFSIYWLVQGAPTPRRSIKAVKLLSAA